jgi:hypothetical protein
MDAFISHASKDTPMAARIEEVLEEDSLHVWLHHSKSVALGNAAYGLTVAQCFVESSAVR